jgi:hypothetical protein
MASSEDDEYARLRALPYEDALAGVVAQYKGPRSGLWLEATAAAERDERLAKRLREGIRKRERQSVAFIEQAQRDGHADPELAATAVARLHMTLRIGSHVVSRLRLDTVDDAALAVLSERMIAVLAADRAAGDTVRAPASNASTG